MHYFLMFFDIFQRYWRAAPLALAWQNRPLAQLVDINGRIPDIGPKTPVLRSIDKWSIFRRLDRSGGSAFPSNANRE